MTEYQIDITCLRCGADVEHVNDRVFQSDRGTGRDSSPIYDTSLTVVQCTNSHCRRQWFIRSVMSEGPTTEEADSRKNARSRVREKVSS